MEKNSASVKLCGKLRKGMVMCYSDIRPPEIDFLAETIFLETKLGERITKTHLTKICH